MICESVFGIMYHSMALVVDALHMFTDVCSYIIAIVSIIIARKKPDYKYTYGHDRMEIVGSICSIGLVYVLVGSVILESYNKLRVVIKCADSSTFTHDLCDDSNPNPKIMVIIGCIGLLSNFLCAGILGMAGISHSHSHGNNHNDNESETSAEECDAHTNCAINNNLKAALFHAIGDAIQLIFVICAGGFIWIYTKSSSGNISSYSNIVDPITSFIGSIIIVIGSVKIVKPIYESIMMVTPEFISDKYKILTDDFFEMGIEGHPHSVVVTQKTILISFTIDAVNWQCWYRNHQSNIHKNVPGYVLEKLQQVYTPIIENDFIVEYGVYCVGDMNINH